MASAIQKILQARSVIFGYVWKDPRAISERNQRQYLDDAGASPRHVLVEKSPARECRDILIGDDGPALRAGHVLAVYRTKYIADDSLDFIEVLGRLARIGASLHVINIGVTIEPDLKMTDLIEQDIAERRKEQTKEARKALEKLPKHKRGGARRTEEQWDEAKRRKFRELWALPSSKCSMREIAREMDVSAPAVKDIAARMKLPPRGA